MREDTQTKDGEKPSQREETARHLPGLVNSLRLRQGARQGTDVTTSDRDRSQVK